MNDSSLPGDISNSPSTDAKLAAWLRQVVKIPPGTSSTPVTQTPAITDSEKELELILDSNYHITFYQQLPDFIMALLNNDPQAALHYAPLLYHLAGCSECHQGYLDLYDAMRAAVQPRQPRPVLGQGTRTLAATPQRMLAHLCQCLVSQAEAILRQARDDSSDRSAPARSLLQLALHISSQIVQSGVRRSALRDLVRVATLFEGPEIPPSAGPTIYSYTPTLTGTGGKRGIGKVTRRFAETPVLPSGTAQESPIIYLQSKSLEGTIVQRDQTLELHLQDLDQALRGHYVSVSVPLGSLIEPVRWRGGDPHAIRSEVPVDASGSMSMPLGETELRLSDREDYRLLEAMFMLLEVRGVDME
jgi:hypothetical protein